ncbi:MAG: TRAP transporter large permease subunit [Oscillospiraceae bacterium]|jgi:Na+/H+ antiporter NhaD/arsenite permease-like protein|nr:TRAP transporter large permease subunit [Oscillospiraceae bacterium]
MIPALIVFIATYVLMLALPKYRHLVALIAAAVFVLLGILPFSEVWPAIDWNVILMLAGTMCVVSLFISSGMPQRLADLMLSYTRDVRVAIVLLALFAGVISAFIDNVATLLIVAPVGLAVSKRLGTSPVPLLIAMSVSSNLQGAATLVGDTTSILLGGYANMNFLDFFVYHGRPGMFFAVELGALATVPVLFWIFRKNKQTVPRMDVVEVLDHVPTAMLVLLVALLICASFIPNKIPTTNGLICCALGLFGIAREVLRRGLSSAAKVFEDIDLVTLLLLIGLFVVVAGVSKAGLIAKIGELFAAISGGNVFIIYTLLTVVSVILSAFIDNIPYIATMLPVVTSISATLGIDPTVLYFGLLSGATLGGNITPIGASANITAIGILRREGHEVKTLDFMKIGVPFTFVAVAVGYAYIWLVFGM